MNEMEEQRGFMMRDTIDSTPTQPAAKIIIPAETISTPVGNGQYSGYRVVDGETFNYTLRIKEDVLTGTLISNDAEELKRYADKLDKEGMEVTGKEGQIQFNGKSEKLDDVIRLLNLD